MLRRAAYAGAGGEAATKVKNMPLVLATDSHAKRLSAEEEQAAADVEEEAEFAQAEREVAEAKVAAAREAAETQASVEEAVETAGVKQAAKQMTAELLARVEEEAEQQAEKEGADAQAASLLEGAETPQEEGKPTDDVDEIKQLMSHLDDDVRAAPCISHSHLRLLPSLSHPRMPSPPAKPHKPMKHTCVCVRRVGITAAMAAAQSGVVGLGSLKRSVARMHAPITGGRVAAAIGVGGDGHPR